MTTSQNTQPLPPIYQPYDGTTPQAALSQLLGTVEHAIVNQPRSLQKVIGPSEIGTPCDHCLAAKLAGWTKTDDGVPWLPFVGTAMHHELERVINDLEDQRNAPHTTGRRYLTEQSVMVGHIGGREVWGSSDLLDLPAATNIDWKLVGETTLRTARVHGPSPVYRVQADLYAKGWNDAGIRVDHVAIVYLPRNAVSLDNAVCWTAPHDRGRAVAALDRANHVQTNLDALVSISTQARDAWISSLPRDPGCHDCARFPDRPTGLTAPGHKPTNPSPLADLIG